MLAPTLVMAFPFVNLLLHHDYGFLNSEAVTLFAGLLVLGSVLGVVLLTHALVRVVLLSVLITVAFTLQLDLAIYPALGLFGALCIVGYVLRRAFSTVVVVFFLALGIAGLVRGSGNTVESPVVEPTDMTLPLYVHIVLDGHIGLSGIPLDIGGGEKIKDELRAFYAKHGFVVYDQAYSHYVATVNSMLNLFNFSVADANHFTPHVGKNSTIQFLDRPRYFQILSESGYALRVVHPQYLDYCSLNEDWVSLCRRYPNLNLQSIADAGFSVTQKISLMAQVLLKQSKLLGEQYAVLQRSFDLPGSEPHNVPAVNPNMIRKLADDIRRDPYGYAYIVHLLFPHPPLVYDADCEIQTDRPASETGATDGDMRADIVDGKIKVTKRQNTPASRGMRYVHYFDHLRCGLKWLESLFAAIKQAGVYDRATIVVHSDHGSKVATLTARSVWADQLTRDDYVDTYSSLFAVKRRGEAGDAGAFLSLQQILVGVTNERFQTRVEVEPDRPFVYMQREDPRAPLHKINVKPFIVPVK